MNTFLFLFRYFAVEVVNDSPVLLQIKKIGHDLDEAVGGEVGDIMSNARRLYCTEHLQKADVQHLKKIGANRTTTEI